MTAITKVYTAFRAAGVPEDEAMEAAEALHAEISELKLSEQRILGAITTCEARVLASESKVLGEVRINRWMLGLIIAALVIPAVTPYLPNG